MTTRESSLQMYRNASLLCRFHAMTAPDDPSELTRLAFTSLRLVESLDGPGSHRIQTEREEALAYLLDKVHSIRTTDDWEKQFIFTWNVTPTAALKSYKAAMRDRGLTPTRGEPVGVDAQVISDLLVYTTYSPPEKARAALQQDILALCVQFAHRETRTVRLCVDALVVTLSQIGAWGKVEFRSLDSVAALWPIRNRHKGLLVGFASSLLTTTALRSYLLRQGEIWAQVQAVCGVLPILRLYATPAQFLSFERSLRRWHRS